MDLQEEGLQYQEVIRLLRLQKHDFLNHLQVATGYLQINNSQKALQYLGETIAAIKSQGQLMLLKTPALATLLLLVTETASRAGVQNMVDVRTDLTGVAGEWPLVETVSRLWEPLLAYLLKLPIDSRKVTIVIEEEAEMYRLDFKVPETGRVSSAYWDEELEIPRSYAERSGYRMLFQNRVDNLISLYFPKDMDKID